MQMSGGTHRHIYTVSFHNAHPVIHNAKYKHLRGGVDSFTEGFTGVINRGFAELARHAIDTKTADFHFDLLAQRSNPPLPDEPWREWLFAYIDPHSWLPRIGVAVEHVASFTVTVRFFLSSYSTCKGEHYLGFEARTEILDDRQHTHSAVRRAMTFYFDDREGYNGNA
jgi:hypothetical protein